MRFQIKASVLILTMIVTSVCVGEIPEKDSCRPDLRASLEDGTALSDVLKLLKKDWTIKRHVRGSFQLKELKTPTSRPIQPDHDRAIDWLEAKVIDPTPTQAGILEISYGTSAGAMDAVKFQIDYDDARTIQNGMLSLSETRYGRGTDLSSSVNLVLSRNGEILELSLKSQSQQRWPRKPKIIEKVFNLRSRSF